MLTLGADWFECEFVPYEFKWTELNGPVLSKVTVCPGLTGRVPVFQQNMFGMSKCPDFEI